MAKKKKKHGPPPVPTSSPLPGWGVGPGLWSRTTGMMEKGGTQAYRATVTRYEPPPQGYYDKNLAVTPSTSRGAPTSKKAPPTSKKAPPPVEQINYYPDPLPGYVPPKDTKAPPTSNTTPKTKGGQGNLYTPGMKHLSGPRPSGSKPDARAKVIKKAMNAHRNPDRSSTKVDHPSVNPSPYSDPYKDMTTEQLSRQFENRDRERRMQSLFNDAQIGRIPSGVDQRTGQGGRSIHSSPGPDMFGMQNSTTHPLKPDPKGDFQDVVGFVAETMAFGGVASLVGRIPWARITTRNVSPRAKDPYWGSQAKDSAKARAAAAREKTKLERPVSDKKKTPKPGPTVKGKNKGKPDDRPGKTQPGESSTKPLPKTKGTRAQRKKQREKMLRDKDKNKQKTVKEKKAAAEKRQRRGKALDYVNRNF